MNFRIIARDSESKTEMNFEAQSAEEALQMFAEQFEGLDFDEEEA